MGGGRFGPPLDMRELLEAFVDQRSADVPARATKVAELHHIHGQPPLVRLIHGPPPQPEEEAPVE